MYYVIISMFVYSLNLVQDFFLVNYETKNFYYGRRKKLIYNIFLLWPKVKANVLLQVKIVQMVGSRYVVKATISGEEVRLNNSLVITLSVFVCCHLWTIGFLCSIHANTVNPV